MKVPLSWLKEYISIDLTPQELSHRLTMSGTEVEGIATVGGSWDNIYVGEVLRVEKHPNADRLKLATVTLGAEEMTVVCGAPNIAQGQKVPFAKVGARLINPHTGAYATLEAAKIRGVVSAGMVCSELELGVSQEHQGIMVLSPDAPVGVPLADYLGDSILDVSPTPNRPDCLSVIGIAQEVAALTDKVVHLPVDRYPESGTDVSQLASVEILAPGLCPRYCASVITGVKIAPSPRWMQERLLKAGMRPISNVVDVTNYVMLEYGQPLHAFDYHRVSRRRIVVRRAQQGERLLTLDGVQRELDSQMLVIADGERSVALAGIMGGGESEVTDSTTAILLESANFNNLSIRRTCQLTKLHTEASIRFDKGLSRELPMVGLRRATQLIQQLAGGEVAKGVIDEYPGKCPPVTVRLTPTRLKKVLGVSLRQEDVTQTLTSLGFRVRPLEERQLEAMVPYWRTDITIEDDLIEEVARVTGLDRLPTIPLSTPIPEYRPQPLLQLKEQVWDILASLGMQEIITYSLTSISALEKAGAFSAEKLPLRVANPMSGEQEYLRTTLRASLLFTLASNQRHEEDGIRLFEVGRVYFPQEADLPQERDMLAGVISGHRWQASWAGSSGEMDFYDAKGLLEALFQRLAVEATFSPGEDLLLQMGRTARVMVKGEQVGVVGEISPQVKEQFDLAAQPALLFEIDLQRLLTLLPQTPQRYHPLPRYPGVNRDIALVLDMDIPVSRVMEVVKRQPLINMVQVFDVYTGDQVSQGKKSIALRLQFLSLERTLTSEEVSKAQEELLASLRTELGAVLRG